MEIRPAPGENQSLNLNGTISCKPRFCKRRRFALKLNLPVFATKVLVLSGITQMQIWYFSIS